MKIFNSLKLAGLLVMAITLTVGCASVPEEVGQEDAAAAIAAAKKANEQAIAEDYAWRDTGKIIKQAEKAMKEGKYDEAVKLANKARRQAENAVKQKYSEMDRIGAKIETPAAAPVVEAPVAAASTQYTVVRGDSLWAISAKPDIYDNPYQWPLIYKANSDKIKDADLIYPGQNFDIDANPSSSEVSAAINHAKTRGAWTLGVVEESDKAYLAR